MFNSENSSITDNTTTDTAPIAKPHRRERRISDISFEEFFGNKNQTSIARRGFSDLRPHFKYRDGSVYVVIPEFNSHPSDLGSLILSQSGKPHDVGFLDFVNDSGPCRTVPFETDLYKAGIDPLDGFDILIDGHRVFVIRPFVFLMFDMSGNWIKHPVEDTLVVYHTGFALKGKNYVSKETRVVGNLVYERITTEPGNSIGAFPDSGKKYLPQKEPVPEEPVPEKKPEVAKVGTFRRTPVKKEFKGDLSSVGFNDFFRFDSENRSERSSWDDKPRGIKVFLPKNDPIYSFSDEYGFVTVYNKPPKAEFTILEEDDYVAEIVDSDGKTVQSLGEVSDGGIVLPLEKEGVYSLVVKCGRGIVTSRRFIYDTGFRLIEGPVNTLPVRSSTAVFIMGGDEVTFDVFNGTSDREAYGLSLKLVHRLPLVTQELGSGSEPIRNNRYMSKDMPDMIIFDLSGRHRKSLCFTDGERQKIIYWYDNRDRMWLNTKPMRGFMRREGIYRLMLTVDDLEPVCVMTVVRAVQ